MFTQATNKPLIAVLTAVPNVTTSLVPELNSLPVQLLSNPPNITFDDEIKLSEFPSEWLSSLNNAEIMISDPRHLGIFKDHLSSLKWCQSTFAGPDGTIKTIKNTPNLLERVENNSLKMTRIGSKLSMPISEYVISNIIRIERRFDKLMDDQNSNLWSQDRYTQHGFRSIKSLRFAIFGIGDIGSTIARSLKYGFGAENIVGLSRTSKADDPEYLELYNKLYTVSELDDLLENESLDYIICVLPHTTETKYLLNCERLNKCKKSKPWLINVGRGSLISTDELLNALDFGILNGAVLDVFESEPLDPNNKLWNKENVIITPHVSGLTFTQDLVDVFVHNLDRYLKDEELDYLVDIHRGY